MKNSWISVKDKLPEFDVKFLLCVKTQTSKQEPLEYIEIGSLESVITTIEGPSRNWRTQDYIYIDDVTHWQPIVLPD